MIARQLRERTTRPVQVGPRSPDRLTVLIPCKDEARNIGPCIESVRPIADEVLVADSGSTDGTLDLVGSLGGCRMIQREYVNSANFKNWAIPQAAHPWVLIVDADERVPPELALEIREVLDNPPAGIDAYRCSFQDFFMGYPLRFSGWDTDSIRLVRRDRCRYEKRRVHADIQIDGRRVGRLKTKITHYSIWNYEDFIDKYNRYTTWGSQELWDRGKRATFRSLLFRPTLRFLHMYIIRRGFLDGLPGLQACILMSFFNTFVKQAKLWHMESAISRPAPDCAREETRVLAFPAKAARHWCLPVPYEVVARKDLRHAH